MIPNFKEEKILWRKGFRFVAGLDEAGRGPLAGPIVAAAVVINSKIKNQNLKLLKGINDSKKLSKKQRDYFYDILINHKDVVWGIGIVSEKVIDKINILQATKLAMIKSIAELTGKIKNQKAKIKIIDYLLIDGNFKINSAVAQKSIIKGDQKVISISAASVIAKVTRDRIMDKYDKKYPQYGFAKHRGYGTKLHMKMIKKFGNCPIHRKSFKGTV